MPWTPLVPAVQTPPADADGDMPLAPGEVGARKNVAPGRVVTTASYAPLAYVTEVISTLNAPDDDGAGLVGEGAVVLEAPALVALEDAPFVPLALDDGAADDDPLAGAEAVDDGSVDAADTEADVDADDEASPLVDDPPEHPTRVVRAQSETAAVMVCRMASSDDGCAGRDELGRSCSAGAS